MSNASLSAAAQALLDAKREARTLPPFTDADPGFDLNRGYEVGFELLALRREQGEKPVGRKVGLTNDTAWPQLGLDAPIWAHMYDTTVSYARGATDRFSLAGLVQPRIEPEFIFSLRAPIEAGENDPVKLLDAVEWLALGFEIVHCHYPGWVFKPADAVADFGLHAGSVIGTPHIVTDAERAALAGRLPEAGITLSLEGDTAATGEGRNVLGNPLQALGYLARVVAGQPQAAPLAAGEVITTGTLTVAQDVAPGQTWTVAVDGVDLPPTRVAFED